METDKTSQDSLEEKVQKTSSSFELDIKKIDIDDSTYHGLSCNGCSDCR